MTLPATREGGVQTLGDLCGPAGRLEALLNPRALSGQDRSPPEAAVVLCHPHPLYGGTLHNKVVYHAMKVFTELGLPVLRFNFRGAGRSEGVHDNGVGEQEDTRAALDWLAQAYEGLPLIAAGFSFGAHMALRAGCSHPRVQALVSLGTPIQAADRTYTYDFLRACTKPTLFLSGTADEFGPVQALQNALPASSSNRTLAWVDGAEHFFRDKLPLMQERLRSWTANELDRMRAAKATA